MKKLITICLFMATVFSVNAQTFEETVSYINDKLKCCSINYSDADYKTVSVIANHDGILSVKMSNSAEYKIDILSLYQNTSEPPIYVKNDEINFSITSTKQKIWRIVSKQEADRIVKALLHLKSLCKKDKELFDN
nr:hypothetical protein [uncultured Flavobacterium sp.]